LNTIYGLGQFRFRKEPYATIDGDVVESCDVCVIGSGAAGAIIAKKLSESGRSVVLLERGGYYEGEDMNQKDEDMMPLLWNNSGASYTDDLRIGIAQGSCLGGSTVINDAVCFPIPDVVRRQWRAMGVGISDAEWDAAISEVSDEIHVTKVSEDELGTNSLMLKRGCEVMGYTKHYANSRNCVNCMRCGLCHLGCHYETKQDMKVTYIHKALNNSQFEARVYCNCTAERITYSGGLADGVEGNFLDADGKPVFKIRVNARLVVVSAGSIASSCLLLKNGIALNRAGKGLAMHPGTWVLGDFPFEIRANQGIPMTYTLHEFGVTNGVEDGGFLIEGIFIPPFQFSMSLPVSGGQHEELMKRYHHYAMAAPLVRDGSNGTITLADSSTPSVAYSLAPKDVKTITSAIEIIAKMWFKLGATRLVTSFMNQPIVESESEIPGLVEGIKKDPGRLIMVSAHPQGGNRMGDDPATCVVDSQCKVHGFKNLYVCDASVFPTALGVNPQLTVMSLATITADRIISAWSDFGSVKLSNKLGEVCAITQPMYCSSKRLEEMYEVLDTALPSQALINSDKKDIVDGENWSFDKDSLTIWNNRYWKGMFANDSDPVSTAILYTGGFWKSFSKTGGAVAGVTHPYEAPVFAKNEPMDVEYPGFGKVIRLKYLEPAFERFYDLLKFVDKDTILGKAFAGRDPPRGEQLLTFSMTRRYGVDFMTQDDFRTIFSTKAKKPNFEEVVGKWEGRLISDSAHSPVMFRFKYYKDQGQPKCDYNFAGALPGTSTIKFTPETMLMFDFTGQLFHDEIRMVRRDFMVGRYRTMGSPIFKLLERAPSFLMKEGDALSLPYTLRRVW
jgi:choline dehydrogenase-like flavoprotein